MHNRSILIVFIAVSALFISFYMPKRIFAETGAGTADITYEKEADLNECIETALLNNRRGPASRYAVEMAEARHRQVLASYWPQAGMRGAYIYMDEYPDFLFPASTMSMPMGGSIDVTIPSVGTVPVSSFSVPSQDVKLMDRDSYVAYIEGKWLLYDGGMRKGYREQTGALVEIMKQESRRTDLEIIDSVKRLYYGTILASELHQLGKDTLARMETTLRFTETMYQEGSGEVKKTDWLDNKVLVESLRAMVALLEKNELMARAALANTMGMPWHSSVKPADKEIPFIPFGDRLDSLVSAAYRFNPDWAKVEAGIKAAEGTLLTAKSGHYPKFALTGELHRIWNDHEAGLMTDRNKEGWSVGVGIEIPLFSGFQVKNQVAEAKAKAAKIKEEQFLLKEGIGLRIRDIFLALKAGEKSYQATLDAMKAAEENRELNTRAYQHGLVETEDIIRSQLMEALMCAQYYKNIFDHAALKSEMELIVGTEINRKIEE